MDGNSAQAPAWNLVEPERPQLPPGRVSVLPRGSGLAGPEPAAGAVAASGQASGTLPGARRVLAVVARPGQESADLGALLIIFRLGGAKLAVMSLTRGEGSEVNASAERPEAIRPWELRMAAGLLGASSVTVADYPDGRLGYLPPSTLADHITRAARRTAAELLLVIDPAASADLDVAAVARAAMAVGRQQHLPVLSRTIPGPGNRWSVGLGPDRERIRGQQRRALEAHRSQAGLRGDGGPPPGDSPDPDCADDREHIRWLVPAG